MKTSGAEDDVYKYFRCDRLRFSCFIGLNEVNHLLSLCVGKVTLCFSLFLTRKDWSCVPPFQERIRSDWGKSGSI